MESYGDQRGMLLSASSKSFPFEFRRVFTLSPSLELLPRGGHAHKICWQFIFPLIGEISVKYINLNDARTLRIEKGAGIVIPPWNWCEVIFKDSNCHVVVICSDFYDRDDYIFIKPKVR